MKRPYNLRPPGGKRKTYSFRCTIKGQQFEITTGESDKAAAWEVAARMWETIENDPVYQGTATIGPSDTLPEVMPLGPFETFLLANFTLIGERVVRLGTGKAVSFYISAHGYKQGIIEWERREKRVLEHRIKFLLHHRWLPRSIDHINRERGDNALANLRASSPFRQARNRGRIGGSSKGKSLQLVVNK